MLFEIFVNWYLTLWSGILNLLPAWTPPVEPGQLTAGFTVVIYALMVGNTWIPLPFVAQLMLVLLLARAGVLIFQVIDFLYNRVPFKFS
jgi:hypothetical protein